MMHNNNYNREYFNLCNFFSRGNFFLQLVHPTVARIGFLLFLILALVIKLMSQSIRQLFAKPGTFV